MAAAEAALATEPEPRRHRPAGAPVLDREGAVDSLVQCRAICGDLPDGLHYRTGRGPGRAALLAAYT